MNKNPATVEVSEKDMKLIRKYNGIFDTLISYETQDHGYVDKITYQNGKEKIRQRNYFRNISFVPAWEIQSVKNQYQFDPLTIRYDGEIIF